MQNISCEMPSWMQHKLESRLLGEISVTSDMWMTPPLWQKAKRSWRASWWKWKRRVKKLACCDSSQGRTRLSDWTQTHVHWVSDAIQPSHPLLSPSPPAPNPSQHQSFSNESTLLMRWPKYWTFSLSIIPSKEHPGLISFRMDWLDLLAVQGTLKSRLQHHSSKASILWRSAFFTVTFTSIHDHRKNNSLD